MIIDIKNFKEVQRSLDGVERDVKSGLRRTLGTTGRFVQAQAKKRCPVSPTQSQASSDFEYNYDAKKSPGTLRDSIKLRLGNGYAYIGIVSGSALKYADVIHNKRNQRWWNLGPGNTSTGSVRVGEKFIDRAYSENKRKITKFFALMTAKVVERV